MAALIKPTRCITIGCMSVNFVRHKSPERWECQLCSITVVSRTMRVTGICRVCKKSKDETPFDNHSNICKSCKSDYNDNYRAIYKDKILTKKKEWYYNLDKKVRWQRVKASVERCPESFLADQMYHIVARNKRPEYSRNPSDPKKLEFDLDRDYLREMWDRQDGRCALTNIEMVHKMGCLNSASIDRIDSALGHIKGNVQIVCLGINRLKHEYSNPEVSQFLHQIKDNLL